MEPRACATLIVASVLAVACGETRLAYESCRPGRDQCLPTDWGAETSCVEWCGADRYACRPAEDYTRPDYAPECLVDGVCRPEACEDLWNCWEDCHLECDEAQLTTGPSAAFVVSAVHADGSIPVGSDDNFSLDLDGDGYLDNRLGQLIAEIMEPDRTGEPDRSFTEAIASGQLLLVMRIHPPQPYQGEKVLVRFQAARMEGDATPLLEGSDRVVLEPDSSMKGSLCGRWDRGYVITDPTVEPLLLPLPMADPSGGLRQVRLEGARVMGRIRAEGIPGMVVGGGVPESLARAITGEALLAELNDRLTLDPEDVIASWFDGACVSHYPGCESLVRGEGDCVSDQVVTEAEIRCNEYFNLAMRPDLPPWRFGTEPRLSLGVQIDAIPVTIVE